MNATDLDAPFHEAGAALSSPASKATARRLRKTRQRLGNYRHDLLVAMRVVNGIEREMLQSEWENWLADENGRCEQARLLVLEGGSGSGNARVSGRGEAAQKVLGGDEKEKKALMKEALRKWYEEYCGSCEADLTALLKQRRPLLM